MPATESPARPVSTPLRAPASTPLSAALARCGDETTRNLVRELRSADAALVDHGAAVAALAVTIGMQLQLPGARLSTLCRAALLHDIGKQYVPRNVLDKPRALLAHERQVVEAHPVLGATMLLHHGLLAEASIVRHHHERWDGTGYPDRLDREAIPLESRIIVVADALDAMTTDRAYRVAMRRETALAEIRRASGSQFDPRCVAALCGPPGIAAG
jgi:putative nucleotidyltransferase with HDIG domain